MAKNQSTATATATETKRSPRGSTKQARAVVWFQEAYAEAVKNAGVIGEALLARGLELSKEFTSVVNKPLSVQLVDVEALITKFYTEAQADMSIMTSRQSELQELFVRKANLEKKIKKADAKPDGEQASDTPTE